MFEMADGALDAILRAGDFENTADPRDWIRKSNRLLDVCLNAGMSYDEPDHHAWAAEYVTKAMLSA
jgi:hypothetical protein